MKYHATLLAGALILAVWPFGHDPFVLPKMFLACAILLDWSLAAPQYGASRMNKPALILIAALLLSTVFSLDPVNSIIGNERFRAMGFLQLIVYALAFQLGFCSGVIEARTTTVFFAIPMAAYSIMERFGFEFTHSWNLISNRGISTQGSPILVGSILVIAFLVALPGARRGQGRRESIAAGIIFLWGVWACDCRSALVGILAGSWVYFHLRQRNELMLLSDRARDAHFADLVLTVSILAIVAGASWFHHVGLRPTDQQRLQVYKTAILAMKAHPWRLILGWGPETFSIAFRQYRPHVLVDMMGMTHVQDQAHNLILHLLLTTGVVGTAAFAWFFWKLARAVDTIGVSILVGILAQSMFEPIHFSAIALLALVLGSRVVAIPDLTRSKLRRYAALASFALVGLIYASDLTWGLSVHASYHHDDENTMRLAHVAGFLNPTSINAMQGNAQIGDDIRARVSLFHPNDSQANQLAGLTSIMRNQMDRAIFYLSKAELEDPRHPGIQGMRDQAMTTYISQRRKP